MQTVRDSFLLTIAVLILASVRIGPGDAADAALAGAAGSSPAGLPAAGAGRAVAAEPWVPLEAPARLPFADLAPDPAPDLAPGFGPGFGPAVVPAIETPTPAGPAADFERAWAEAAEAAEVARKERAAQAARAARSTVVTAERIRCDRRESAPVAATPSAEVRRYAVAVKIEAGADEAPEIVREALRLDLSGVDLSSVDLSGPELAGVGVGVGVGLDLDPS